MSIFSAMAVPFDGEGACFFTVRDKLATIVEAARRNLLVGGSASCDAAKYGFPREMMAKDFKAKVKDLAYYLCFPKDNGKAVTHPIGFSSPIEIRCAVTWLNKILIQQMEFWGWAWPSEEHSEDEPERLVYRISPTDLDKFVACLDRFNLAASQNAPAMSESTPTVDLPREKQAAVKKGRQHKGEACKGHYISSFDDENGPYTPTELARVVGCDPGTASRAIKELKGLAKAQGMADRRQRQDKQAGR